MKMLLEREHTAPDVPYTLWIDQLDDTIMSGSRLQVPVHYDDLNNTYNVEMSGFRVEAQDATSLPKIAQPLFDALINVARLPSYVFVARRSRAVYPIYTVGDEVMATTPGGPVFRHIELAKVRDYLNDYLHETGVLGKPGRSDKLHVRGVDPVTLELVRPIFYFKKRIPDQIDFWAPVFLGSDSIYTFAASERREAPLEDGLEILKLHRTVAEALIGDQRLRSSHDLRADRLFSEAWERLKRHCTLDPQRLNLSGKDIAVYRCLDLVIGVEERNEGAEIRPSLFINRTIAELGDTIAADFERRGIGTVLPV